MRGLESVCVKVILIGLLVLSSIMLSAFGASAQEAKINRLMMDYTSGRGDFSVGIHPIWSLYSLATGGILPYAQVGILNQNGFGYPTGLFGLTTFLGFDYRAFLNVPNAMKVEATASSRLQRNPEMSYSSLVRAVRRKIDPGVFTYFQVGTEIFIIPKIGFGFFIPVWEKGFVDLGLTFPLLINASFFVAF